VEAAAAWGAEFILVAGDTFEHNAVDRLLVQKAADILGGSGVPVYVIPGNHDPLVPGSVWDHPVWGEQPGVRVLREAEPLALAGGTLYPCPVLEKHSRKDPTAWIREARLPGDRGIRIGVAHGTVEGMPQADPDHPIPREAAARTGLDYLALGHWHSTTLYEEAAGGPVRMAYSGTHETTRFGERDSGNVLLVEIARPGDAAAGGAGSRPGLAPRVTPLRTGGLQWITHTGEIGRQGDLARVRALLEGVENPETALIEVRLLGLLPASDGAEPARLAQLLESRFLYHRLDTGGLRPAPEDDSWLEGLPHGALREAALRLRELAGRERHAAGNSPGDPASESRIAAQALLELYALAQEAER
jgi:predicted phosphodiesterase